MSIVSVTNRTSGGVETVLSPMTIEEYQAIPDKSVTGTPTKYYYERGVKIGYLYLNCIHSDTTDTLDIVVLREIEDFDATTNNPDFPKGWERALVYNLALDLCPSFGIPVAQVKVLSTLAEQSLRLANSFHPQICDYYFEPGRDD